MQGQGLEWFLSPMHYNYGTVFQLLNLSNLYLIYLDWWIKFYYIKVKKKPRLNPDPNPNANGRFTCVA